MGELDGLTAGQMREAAEVLRAWIADRQHDAQVAAEVLDRTALDGARSGRTARRHRPQWW